MEQGEQQNKEESIGSSGLVSRGPVKKTRKRLASEEKLRHELVYQLRESLRSTHEKMNSQELTLIERQRWTQIHTYTAQAYNTILRVPTTKRMGKTTKRNRESLTE